MRRFFRLFVFTLCMQLAVFSSLVSALNPSQAQTPACNQQNASSNQSPPLDSNQCQTLLLGRSGILWFDTGNGGGLCTASVNLVGSDNEQKAFNFFLSQGLNNIQTAAIVGNFMQESSMVPTRLQVGGTSNNPYDAGSEGWGIAQWSGNAGPKSTGDKVTAIYKASGVSGPAYDLGTQLDMVWWEMNNTTPTGFKNLTQGLKQINDLPTAVEFFRKNFEGGTPGRRQQFAEQALQLYGSGSTVLESSGTTSGSSCAASVTCSNPAASAAAADVSSINLSQTRQTVVCLAEQELSLWKSQPGYPHTSYAATGFLKYSDGWYEEWCADFASWIYNQAGYPFSGGQAGGWMLAGVSEIQALGQQNQKFHWHPASSNYVPKPGDLAIHGGDHVNIFISSAGGVSTYIGGDQGQGPYGHVPALAPGSPTPNPPSASVVSTDIQPGYYSEGITGYVSPD